jgi:DNA-binding MarR family transcriptional regulator
VLNIGLLLFIPYRNLEKRLFETLREAGFDDFTPAQARVAQRIAADGSRITDLAESANITKQSAGFLVDQLERAGYVERVPDPSDARARLVKVAARGEAAAAVSNAMVEKVEAEWEAYLGKAKLRQLKETLARLRELTDPYA